ncbi:phage tail sheath family protein (plasmid) [Lysinibacillus capsici]|uniref:phage tail sheath family protein n=1 Tax=Lysinibacillus capsici TaxID=2115968 RepID=UPI0021D7EA5D|nr:phage tail sheath family protein [Lysinibacillus capsici]UYB50381.1 phage tail sheath family protein [Lysinibacillus capsici]
MAFRHGSRVTEAPTSLMTPVVATATLNVVFGTAPINLAKTPHVNQIVVAYSFGEAQAALGYSDDWKNYTLCEAMDAAFRLYNVAPVIFVNVLDPEKHNEAVKEEVPVENQKAVISIKGILLDTLKVKRSEADEIPLNKDEDYVVSFDDDGQVVIVPLVSVNKLFVEYTRIAPEKVTENDIIGGSDVNTGKVKGLELINSVFPKTGMVPGIVIAPKFAKNPMVAAVMKAKASVVNTYFRAVSLSDIDSAEADIYTKVNEWKNQNNYTGANEFPGWPLLGLGDKVYHYSTQFAFRIAKTAAENGDYPHVSPSNQPLQMTKLLNEAGDEIDLGPDQAELLNSQGITTALNFMGGWKCWGNRTGAYPGSTDVKDIFIPVRLTHNWIANTIILTTWSKVDAPITRRLIDSITDTMNMWFNGLQSRGVILGGRVVFKKENNPTPDLINGKIRINYYVAESTPAEDIEGILEFDPTYYNNLFE